LPSLKRYGKGIDFPGCGRMQRRALTGPTPEIDVLRPGVTRAL